MSPVQVTLAEAIRKVVVQLRELQVPDISLLPIENLSKQLDEPCVVAIVGRMKAGKSTFINALLEADLAPVGVTETTATINYFRAGQPDHPDLPVRCKWRGCDTIEPQSVAFLESLQGNDSDTLRRAGEIEYLEYLLSHAFLQQVTLVDTPGIASVVEDHQNVTAEYMRMFGQLRSPYEQETSHLDKNGHSRSEARWINSSVDAVIYVFGTLPGASDQRFLNEFAMLTGGRSQATNAIGVMTKIDLHSDLPDGPETRTVKYAALLRDQVHTIMPVSAGLQRALDRLRENQWVDLNRIIKTLHCLDAKHLAQLLESPEDYLEEESPVSLEERKELLGKLDWTVFKTIVTAAETTAWNLPATIDLLTKIAGFGPLRLLLQQHFFARGQLIRSYRIAKDALKMIRTIRFQFISALSEANRAQKERLTRFLVFLNQIKSNQIDETDVRQELIEFVITHSASTGRIEHAEKVFVQVERDISKLYHALKGAAEDIEALQLLNDYASLFADSQELEELQALFGRNGIEKEQRLLPENMNAPSIDSRAQYWGRIHIQGKPPLSVIAGYATTRYGYLLDEIRR